MNSILKLFLAIAVSSSLTACGVFTGTPLSNNPHSSGIDKIDHSAMSKEALRWLGRPYRFGGTNPASGFDCSGLVYYSALVTRGGVLPRTVLDQYAASSAITMSNAKSGDLVFFQVGKTSIDHVGIYLGKNQFVHAPRTGGVVHIVDMNNPYWTKRFAGVRRLRV